MLPLSVAYNTTGLSLRKQRAGKRGQIGLFIATKIIYIPTAFQPNNINYYTQTQVFTYLYRFYYATSVKGWIVYPSYFSYSNSLSCTFSISCIAPFTTINPNSFARVIKHYKVTFQSHYEFSVEIWNPRKHTCALPRTVSIEVYFFD